MLRRLSRRLEPSRDDAGFTLVELLVTMGIISTILLGLLSVQLGALSTVTLSRERQQATDLANRTMEQLRALPYDTVAAGSLNTDPTLTSDPNVVSGRYKPAFNTSIDEILVTGGSASSVPLFPHIQSNAATRIGPVQFRVATYVTLASGTAGDTSQGYRLSVVVSWASPRTGGQTKTIQVRSQAYSPTGCLSTATHPFSGPCQAFFDAAAVTSPAGISISTDSASGFALDGNPLKSATVGSPTLSSVVQSEQIVSTQSTAATSQVRLLTDSGETSSGGVSAATGATTDPATGASTAPEDQTASQTGGTLTAADAGSTFTLEAGASDSAEAASTSKAVASAAGCRTVADLSVTSQQACSSGSATQGGPLSAELTYGATIPLASVQPAANSSRALAARYTTPATPFCATAAGVGCVAADMVRSLGLASVGGAPSGASGLPSGFTRMASITGYTSRATADSGVGAGASTASRAGTLTYWGGTAPVDLSSTAAQSLTIAPVSFSYTGSGGVLLDVTMSGSVSIGAVSSTPSGVSPCQPTACGVESSSGSVVASVTYDITSGSTPVGRFTVDLDLGAASAKTSYRAAPSA